MSYRVIICGGIQPTAEPGTDWRKYGSRSFAGYSPTFRPSQPKKTFDANFFCRGELIFPSAGKKNEAIHDFENWLDDNIEGRFDLLLISSAWYSTDVVVSFRILFEMESDMIFYLRFT